MCKRIVFILCFLISSSSYGTCVLPQATLDDALKTPGIRFIEAGSFKTREQALDAAAANIPRVNLSESDLCYTFANKWGTDGYIERGTRMGNCTITLFNDLNYKESFPSPLQIQKERDITQRRDTALPMRTRLDGDEWPMLDCNIVPPRCAVGFSALRISNLMQNETTNGLVNGDKTILVQEWTCIKI